jgi:hypothetical protein
VTSRNWAKGRGRDRIAREGAESVGPTLSTILAASPQRPLGDVGRVQIARDQTYQAIGEEPYTRRDGSQTTVIRWRSECMTCGQPFECVTAINPARFRPLRNCPAHRHHRSRRDRIRETDPASIAPTLPDGRPVPPLDVYEDRRR